MELTLPIVATSAALGFVVGCSTTDSGETATGGTGTGGTGGTSASAGGTGGTGGTIVQVGSLGRGINLAGAEFGTNVPGTYDVDYTYPTNAEIDRYMGFGMTVFRIPFLWERLQPTLGGDFDATEFGRLDSLVQYATGKGAKIILDPHNYARYGGELIGSDAVPNAQFANFWSRLATEYADSSLVAFGIMNEPHDVTADVWLVSANAAIAAIRETGATNLVLVPGTLWTGAHSWFDANKAMIGVVDSANNFAFEVHQYLNSDSSGATGECVSATIGVERVTEFTDWLEENGVKGFLGEFGAGVSSHTAEEDAPCLDAMNGMLDYIEGKPDLWIGWTYFAGGPWWAAGTSYTIADTANPWQLEALKTHL